MKYIKSYYTDPNGIGYYIDIFNNRYKAIDFTYKEVQELARRRETEELVIKVAEEKDTYKSIKKKR